MDEGSSNAVVDEFRLTDGFTVAPGEEKTVPVTIDIPVETPVTMGDADAVADKLAALVERLA